MSQPNYTAQPVETNKVLPLYFLCDVSESMGWPKEAPKKPIDALNEGLKDLIVGIKEIGDVRDLVRISVISFSSNSRVELPLASIEMETVLPQLTAGGVTNLKSGLELLSNKIAADIKHFIETKQPTYRPTVFIFTDGVPTNSAGEPEIGDGEWGAVLDELDSKPWTPRVYPYPLGAANANMEILKRLAKRRGVDDELAVNRITSTTEDVVLSIKRIIPHLMRTIVAASEMAQGGASDKDVSSGLDSAIAAPLGGDPDDDFDKYFNSL